MHPRKLVRDALGLALSSYIARAALLARGVVAAAALGPKGYGGWNALNLILDYGSYATLGAIQGLDLELPASVGGDPEARLPERARRLLAGTWWIIGLGGALFSVVVVAALVSGRPAAARALGMLRRRAPIPLVPAHPATGWSLVRAGFPVFAFFTASLILRSVDRLA